MRARVAMLLLGALLWVTFVFANDVDDVTDTTENVENGKL
jgi:hypothetical protein